MTIDKLKFRRALIRAGRRLDQVRPAIVGETSLAFEVNDQHAAVAGVQLTDPPKMPRAPEIVPTPAPQRKANDVNLDASALWPVIHETARAFNGTAPAFMGRMRELATVLKLGGCACETHWAKYIDARPLASVSVGDRWRWTVEARAEIADRLERRPFTIAEAAAAQGVDVLTARIDPAALHIHNSATGLGDAVSGLYAACGLADAAGRPVIYHAHSAAWLAGVRHPNLYITPIEFGAHGVDVNDGHEGYKRQIAIASSRTAEYCRNTAERLGVRTFAPKRPEAMLMPPPRQSRRYVVLAPFSCYSSREWPADRWRELAEQLVARGLAVHAIGNGNQAERLRSAFDQVAGVKCHHGHTAASVLQLLGAAAVIIGNDSGVAHVGGLLGRPTLCVHAGSLPHDFLFDQAPTVRSVTAGRILARADHAPSELADITVDQVMQSIDTVAHASEGKP